MSNVTVGAGVLNGIFALTFFAAPVFADKDSYVLLSLLLTALIGLAPFVYSLI